MRHNLAAAGRMLSVVVEDRRGGRGAASWVLLRPPCPALRTCPPGEEPADLSP